MASKNQDDRLDDHGNMIAGSKVKIENHEVRLAMIERNISVLEREFGEKMDEVLVRVGQLHDAFNSNNTVKQVIVSLTRGLGWIVTTGIAVLALLEAAHHG